MNLLAETISDINSSGHDISEIVFIGSEESGHSCTWDKFTSLADKDYHSGYGAQEVASDLIVVFSDGATMKRGEYDGSEWWEYSKPFTKPEATKEITSLFGGMWGDLEEANKEKQGE